MNLHHFALAAACGFAIAPLTTAADPADLPLLLTEDFSAGIGPLGADRPQGLEARRGRAGNKVFSQHAKSTYKPPHRSPFNIALLKDVLVGDFVLEARCRSTVKDYGHRDMCLFFGYQDPAHFYYVHLGKQTDDHANQIFIVNGAPRMKISTKTTRRHQLDRRLAPREDRPPR